MSVCESELKFWNDFIKDIDLFTKKVKTDEMFNCLDCNFFPYCEEKEKTEEGFVNCPNKNKMRNMVLTMLNEEYDINYDCGNYKEVYISCDHDYVLKTCFEDDPSIRAECWVWDRAIEEGVEEYFLPYISLGNGYFLQKKIDATLNAIGEIGEKEFGLPSFSEEHNCATCKKNINDIYGDVCSECMTCWSIEKKTLVLGLDSSEIEEVIDYIAPELSAFLAKYSIFDLHDGNIGYLDGKIKIIDCFSRVGEENI